MEEGLTVWDDCFEHWLADKSEHRGRVQPGNRNLSVYLLHYVPLGQGGVIWGLTVGVQHLEAGKPPEVGLVIGNWYEKG